MYFTFNLFTFDALLFLNWFWQGFQVGDFLCQLLCLRPVCCGSNVASISGLLRLVFCGSNVASISGLSIIVCLSIFSYVYLWTLQCEWDKKKELFTLLASGFAPVFGRLHHAKIFSFLWCIFCFVCLRSVPCARYYPGIWIFHSWLPLRFSLIFISIAYLPWIPNDRKLYNAKCLKSIWNSLVIWSKARNQFRV